MQTYPCPSCGAEVKFQSSVSMTCVCPFCRSLIVRHDKDVEAMGKMAELPDDISPFQIGTTGTYNRVHFALIGRARMTWQDGGWNEWFAWFEDGQKGWLAEAQGFLALSFPYKMPENAQAHAPTWMGNPLRLKQEIYLNRQPFTVTDLKKAECVACEGELPSILRQGDKTYSADLTGIKGQFASIDCDERWIPGECYLGTYVEFNALGFNNLRELPGWKKPLTSAADKAGEPA